MTSTHTAQHTTRTKQPTRRGQSEERVRQATVRTIGRLQAGYRKDSPPAVAAVARLRREAGHKVYEAPGSWGLDHLEELTRLRDQDKQAAADPPAPPHRVRSAPRVRQEEQENREDRAVHLAVTLWALHQQSLREEPMHVPDWSLGRAVRRLAEGRTGTSDPEPPTTSAPTNRSASEEIQNPAGATPDDVDGAGGTAVDDPNQTIRQRFVRIGTATDFDMVARRLREMVLLLRGARIPLDYGRLAEDLYRWQVVGRQGEVRRDWGRDFHRAYRRQATTNTSGDAA